MKEDRIGEEPYAKTNKPLTLPDWGDFNVLLEVIRAGSLNRAAQSLSLTQPTVTRHIDRLERSLGAKVLERTSAGATLTREGATIIEELNAVRNSMERIVQRFGNPAIARTETVRLITTDGIASYWIPRFLPAFFDSTNGVELRISTANVAGPDKNDNYDMSVHFMQPNDPHAKVYRLGTFHFIPYASPKYLEKHGCPKTPREFGYHRLLDHAFYLIDKGTWRTRLPEMFENPKVNLFTNSSTVLVESIRNGMGIAFLPTYVSLFEKDLVPIDVEMHYTTPIYLCFDGKAAERYGCRAAIHFLKHIFDKRSMPWLRDEYVSPKDFSVVTVDKIMSGFSLKPTLALDRQNST
jgi:DNA-binding transcriptional LysR family regulator